MMSGGQSGTGSPATEETTLGGDRLGLWVSCCGQSDSRRRSRGSRRIGDGTGKAGGGRITTEGVWRRWRRGKVRVDPMREDCFVESAAEVR